MQEVLAEQKKNLRSFQKKWLNMNKRIDENWLYSFRSTLLKYREASRKYYEAKQIQKQVLQNDTTDLQTLKAYCGDWINTRREIEDAIRLAEQGKPFVSRNIAQRLLDDIIDSYEAYKTTQEQNLISRLHSIKFFDIITDEFVNFFNTFLIDEYVYKTEEQVFKETQEFLDSLKNISGEE